MQTPEAERGPLWWLEEYRHAERAVSAAAAMAERDPTMGRVWDARLDHLAVVDDACEQILACMAASAGPDVADLARAHWLDGTPWATLAAERGERYATTYGSVRAAVCGVGWPLAGG